MKKTLLLATTLVAGLLATAQTPKFNPLIKHNDKKHLNFVNSLLHTQRPATAQKPTGTAQRVIAQAASSTEYSDSTRFKYTGTKGSRYNHNSLEFGYNLEFSSNYAPMVGNVYEYNALDMLADSISSYENDTLYQVSKGFYRSDNKLDSFFLNYYDGTNPPEIDKTLHSFYPGGYVKEVISLSHNGTTFDTNQIRRLTYNNTFDRIITDTILANVGISMQPVMATTYHYNAQGNADTIATFYYSGSSFEPVNKSVISYTNSEKIQKIFAYTLNSTTGQYELYQKDSFAYANNADYFTFWEYDYFDQAGTIQDGTKIIKHPGANGFPDSVSILYLNNSNWEEDVTLHYTYNDYNNPATITVTIDGEPEEGMIKFYYETYEDGISGIDPIANNKDFNVYPNPFSNNINIDWKGKQQSNVTIRLTNIVGQEVYKTSMKLTAGKNAVSIPSLNSGNYILLIQDADGKSWSSKMVKK
ncbi:MAG: T9SS type A sorting domain-containing protein [Taibaiella sp.]|jgi:hypothetical protein